ncbi:(2Fe-2S)-binding protein [Oceanidesulfovibrio indonesiensis]|uniref:(2Fe-2S)-binding protein n=1 Tax=Oceanidesulfovibrio indonesiensis TaxID=54767 RepID=A0A7M3MGP7_9BACT|nr:(2Fe-2S)-binding protein [Oceanidesulfovibrio indonesiensis]
MEVTINGVQQTLDVDGDRPLLWVLRTDMGLTGTKYGCGIGLCGSCVVLIDGVAARSCQIFMSEVAGKEVTTIEGLAAGDEPGDLHPVQQAFMEHDALQCGYCTPGMILQGVSLLTENPDPNTEEIVNALEGNLCRCGAHKRIVQAMHTAAKMKGGG